MRRHHGYGGWSRNKWIPRESCNRRMKKHRCVRERDSVCLCVFRRERRVSEILIMEEWKGFDMMIDLVSHITCR